MHPYHHRHSLLHEMHMSIVVMKNEYIHVCTKGLTGLNFQLHIPHVKNDAKF